MRTIELLNGKIILTLDDEEKHAYCEDFLKEKCSFCGSPDCEFDCDESQYSKSPESESEEEVKSRIQFNAAVDGITALVLTQACAGMVVTDPKYQKILQDCLDAVGNYYS